MQDMQKPVIIGKKLFPFEDNSSFGNCILDDATRVLEVDSGYYFCGMDHFGFELEALRRLSFFQIDELTLNKWVKAGDTQGNCWAYWALMHHWLVTWEQVSGHEWDYNEYKSRSELLLETLHAHWAPKYEKNDYKIATDHSYITFESVMNEAIYFNIAHLLFYDGGLCHSFKSLENKVPFETVFPLDYAGLGWKQYRANTGREY